MLGRTGDCWAARDERKGAAVVDLVGLVGLLLGFFFSWIFLLSSFANTLKLI